MKPAICLHWEGPKESKVWKCSIIKSVGTSSSNPGAEISCLWPYLFSNLKIHKYLWDKNDIGWFLSNPWICRQRSPTLQLHRTCTFIGQILDPIFLDTSLNQQFHDLHKWILPISRLSCVLLYPKFQKGNRTHYNTVSLSF